VPRIFTIFFTVDRLTMMQHIIEAYLTRWYLCITTLTRVRSIEVTVHFVKEFLLVRKKMKGYRIHCHFVYAEIRDGSGERDGRSRCLLVFSVQCSVFGVQCLSARWVIAIKQPIANWFFSRSSPHTRDIGDKPARLPRRHIKISRTAQSERNTK
jgi:hypothetical protein